MVGASRPRVARVLLGAAIACAVAGGPARGGDAAPEGLSDYRIKAAYLYYFTTYVDWPGAPAPGAEDALVIGVLGTDPFGQVLDDTLRGKVVKDRPVVLRRIRSVKEARDIQILFIGSSEEDRLPSLFKALEGAAVLTVGETDRFAARGGQIGFRLEGNKVRFDINLAAVQRAGLKMSAQLVKLGTVVADAGKQGG